MTILNFSKVVPPCDNMFIQKKARIVEFMNCLEQFDGFGKNKINIPTASGTVSNASVAGTQNL